MDMRDGTWRRGAIVWREAATSDLERTTAFYAELFGWKHKDSDMGAMGIYRQFEVGGQTIAGCYKLGESMAGVPPHWIQYISVDDVDAAAAKVTANGGGINMGPMDIPNVGRAVYIRDPQGANVALFRDLKGDGPTPEGRPPVGTFCWESLNTTDKAGAAAFYTTVVGFQITDFGGMQTFSLGTGPMDGVADIGDAPPGVPPHWLSHVVVANLDESRDRAARLGAHILMGEIAIPNVGRIAIIADPVGAAISLFEPAPA